LTARFNLFQQRPIEGTPKHKALIPTTALAEVNDNGGLTIEWEFELRKEVVMGKGKELLSTFYIFFQTLYISDKVNSPDY